MLFENPETQQLLSRIVARLSSDPASQDDLMQEGLIHLWQTEARLPDQSLSWYLQSCQFHLRHYLAAGRSVDSWKRRQQRISVFQEDDDETEPIIVHVYDSTAFGETSAEEILRLLHQRLSALQQTVLAHLADGLSSREVGVRLGICHKTVARHRRKIATLALEMGIAPD